MIVWKMPFDHRELACLLDHMARACGLSLENVELALTDDAQISVANERYLGCRGPTNIVSFPSQSGAPGQLLLSVDTLRRECLLYGQNPAEHAIRLLAHGLAHLTGLDHGPEMDHVQKTVEKAGLQALREVLTLQP